MELKDNTCFEVSANIVHRKLNDSGFMLIELEGNELFELHDVGGKIWEEILQGSNFREIISSLENTYEPFGVTEVGETKELLKELIKKKIIAIR